MFKNGLPRPPGQPAEIRLGARDVFEDLRLEGVRALEFLLIAEPPQELDAYQTWRRACERLEQEGLDRQAIVTAERWPVTDIGHRFPMAAAAIEIGSASDIHAALGQHLRSRGEIQRRHGLLRAHAVTRNHLALKRIRPQKVAGRSRHRPRLHKMARWFRVT